MPIKLQKLQVRVQTNGGMFGVDLDLDSDLLILQAENTSGKSTCAMAILYALGLEGMLGPSHAPPFGEVVTKRLQTGDNESLDVLSAYVKLSISNGSDFCDIQRSITGTSKERGRVRVFPGKENGPHVKPQDYYVRAKRSAQSELGFHSFLAEFIGLDLPQLRKFDGDPIPLYLECITPFAFVDQLSGWRDIKARMPTYLPIPDMIQRVIEYILNLDVLARELRKEELEKEESRLRSEWFHAIREAKASMPRLGFVIRNLPDSPPDSPDTLQPIVYLSSGDIWIELDDELQQLTVKVKGLSSFDVPSVGEISDAALNRIRRLEQQLTESQTELEKINFHIQTDRSQVVSIAARLSSLRENLRQYEDEKRLRDRGGIPFSGDDIARNCPVCGSATSDALVDHTSQFTPMLLEENIAYLRDQVKTFRILEDDLKRTIDGKEQKAVATRQRVKSVAESLRAEKEQLRQLKDSPSVSAVRERLQAESRLDLLSNLRETLKALVQNLRDIHKRFLLVLQELKGLRGTGLSESDLSKLDRLGRSYLRQLQEYDFSSYPLEEIGVSKETYRPSHLGFDLGLTSASDSIRSIWAYLLAVLETAVSEKCNHLGFLLLDEPRQQMVKDLSHEALIQQSARVCKTGAQILVFTSQKRAEVQNISDAVGAKLIKLDKWIIRKIPLDNSADDSELA